MVMHNYLKEYSRKILHRLDKGYSLPSKLRREMEASFGVGFGDVVLHDSELTHKINRMFGSLAFTINNHICFADGVYDTDSEQGRKLLIHELAHVVQKRLGVGAPFGSGYSAAVQHRLEAEAYLAAEIVSCGGQYRCMVADSNRQIMFWNIEGHYFTTYLVLLNEGYSQEDAQRLALWCWLPDQVYEFEAVEMMKPSWFGLIEGSNGNSITSTANDTLEREGHRVYGYDSFLTGHTNYVKTVHLGFHVLNGGNADDEVKRRKEIFSGSAQKCRLYRGLTLHAFGDCFAHRTFSNPKQLSDPYVGHAVDTGPSFPIHDPDFIWAEKRGRIYMDYVRGLSELVATNGRKYAIEDLQLSLLPLINQTEREEIRKELLPKHKRVDFDKVLQLSEIRALNPTSEDCIKHIKNVAQNLGFPMNSAKDPDSSTDYWENYFKKYMTPLIQDCDATFLNNPYRSKEPRSNNLIRDAIFRSIFSYCGEWSNMRIQKQSGSSKEFWSDPNASHPNLKRPDFSVPSSRR